MVRRRRPSVVPIPHAARPNLLFRFGSAMAASLLAFTDVRIAPIGVESE
jgi:hypothetical protein